MSTATDTFTDTDGTLLPSHTADTGQSWTRAPGSDASSPGDFVIRSNRVSVEATATSDGATAILGVNPSSANYSMTGALFLNDGVTGINSNFPTLILRGLTSARTGYYARQGDAGIEWRIYRVVAGSFTSLVTTSGMAASSASDTLNAAFSVTDHGDGSVDLSLTVDVNGSFPVTATVNDAAGSALTAAGNPGIALAGGNGATIGKSWDRVVVTYTAGAVATPTLFHRSQTYSRRRGR